MVANLPLAQECVQWKWSRYLERMEELSVSEPPPENGLNGLFDSAVEYFEAGDVSAARDVLERLIAEVPDDPQILNYLAVTTHQTGDPSRARELFERAVRIEPDFAEAWSNLGSLTHEMGEFDRAIKAFSRLCKLTPNEPGPFICLGHALQANQQCSQAVSAYKSGLSLSPNHPDAWSNLSRALLSEGRWQEALDAADRELALQPGHTGAMALKSVALMELGRGEEWSQLVDLSGLLQVFEISVPGGHADIVEFNRTLSTYCKNHPSLVFNPKNNTTELGLQTANMANDGESGPIAGLIGAIGICVEGYIEAHPISPAHPFLSQRPEDWTFDIWATVLGDGGHQSSHIHRDGWLSGVYYAQLPDSVSAGTPGHAGWIEFGRQQVYPKSQSRPRVQVFQPVEGKLLLFPSYFYHRTLPFNSETQRISIAFDLVPTGAVPTG